MKDNKDKPTVLLFPFALLLGSTHPLVAVGEELAQKGYRVVFASSGKFMDYIHNLGFETEIISDLDEQWFTSRVSAGSMEYHNTHSLEAFVVEEVALIEKYRPEVVIDIHRPSLHVSCEITGVKKVSVVDVIFTKYYACKKSMPETHWLNFLNSYSPTRRIASSILPSVEGYLVKNWARPYNHLLRKHKRDTIHTLKDTLEGDITIFMDAYEFAPINFMGNTNLHFVGPILHTDKSRIPEWYETLDKDKKTIFLSMGSSGILFPKVLEFLLKRFRNSSDYQVVATTSLNHDAPKLDYPEHFFITDYVPAELILSLNCVISIVHGGRGSTYHALSHGVPVLGIPHQAEQEWNLERVQELQVGSLLHAKKLNYESFVTILEHTLGDTFSYNAKQFAKKLEKYQGQRDAADLIHNYILYQNNRKNFQDRNIAHEVLS